MQLKDIMSKSLITIPMGTRLSEATELMTEKRIRHLPVVDKSGSIIGILSSKDLPPFSEIRDLKVEYFMSTAVIVLPQEAPIKDAALKMLENKISSIVVYDEEGKASGIVTSDDLLWYLFTQLQKENHKSAFSTIVDLPTIGQLAHTISNAGI